MIRSLGRLFSRKLMIAAAAGAMLVPSLTFAGDRDRYDRGDRYDYRRDDRHDDFHFNFGFSSGPVYRDRVEQVWVAPVYRTVCDRVWCEPVVQDVRDRVWVDSVYEFRDVVRYERGRRVIVRERVLVSPGHYEDRHRQVVVTPGHWDNVERQELVTPGHWEPRTRRVPVAGGTFFGFGF
jgi:hypothetical protein